MDQHQGEAAPMDPIALTLAVWLGLIVGVTGLIRLSERAASDAALAQASRGGTAAPGTAGLDMRAAPMRMVAFGG